MDEIIRNLRNLIQEACEKCHSKTISLSGGLDSSILAYELKGRGIKAFSLISEDFISTDLTYCQMVSKQFHFPLEILTAKTIDLIKGAEETIKILGNFNDIEIRNNLVMYLIMKRMKKEGKTKLVTGDGADELFAGYNFLKKVQETKLDSEIERLRNIMHFPTQKIAKKLGVELESPFLNEKIIKISKEIPSTLKIRRHGNKIFGKWVLRKAYENDLPPQIVWREKSPLQEGSGTSGLTRFFEAMIPDPIFEKKRKKIKENEGIKIRSKESLTYYEMYKKYFETPGKQHSSKSKCPYCQYKIRKESRFCRMCGAFPV